MGTCYRCNGSGINKHQNKKEDLQAFYKLCRELEQENKDDEITYVWGENVQVSIGRYHYIFDT